MNTRPAPKPAFYLEPLGLIPREEASGPTSIPALGGAMQAGWVALWQLGPPVSRKLLSPNAFAEWREALPRDDSARVETILKHWSTPFRFAGLPGIGYRDPVLMGVVNTTSDSFYAESRRATALDAIAEGHRLADQGAAIIDVGGQSTRPGSTVIAEQRELAATLPVVAKLAEAGIVVSIDTIRPSVASAAIAAGARVINDVSGSMPASALAGGASIILGHAHGTPTTMQRWPRSAHGLFSIYDWFETRIDTLIEAGVPRERIAIDPGFGFGKAVHHNQALLKHLLLFTGLGVAIALGVSRKASLGFVTGTPRAADRLPASIAASLIAVQHGTSLLRVHDVAATRQALQIARFFG